MRGEGGLAPDRKAKHSAAKRLMIVRQQLGEALEIRLLRNRALTARLTNMYTFRSHQGCQLKTWPKFFRAFSVRSIYYRTSWGYGLGYYGPIRG
jgi:hypothetical protein